MSGDQVEIAEGMEFGGTQGWDRTTDTRMFTPLLYRLSYLGRRLAFLSHRPGFLESQPLGVGDEVVRRACLVNRTA